MRLLYCLEVCPAPLKSASTLLSLIPLIFPELHPQIIPSSLLSTWSIIEASSWLLQPLKMCLATSLTLLSTWCTWEGGSLTRLSFNIVLYSLLSFLECMSTPSSPKALFLDPLIVRLAPSLFPLSAQHTWESWTIFLCPSDLCPAPSLDLSLSFWVHDHILKPSSFNHSNFHNAPLHLEVLLSLLEHTVKSWT